MIKVPASYEGMSTLKEPNCFNVRFHTQEISPVEQMKLLDYKGQFGWLLFKPSEKGFTEEDIPDYDPDQFDEIKSPSQRLKAVIFVHSQQEEIPPSEFNQFYRKQMDLIIEGYKRKNLEAKN